MCVNAREGLSTQELSEIASAPRIDRRTLLIGALAAGPAMAIGGRLRAAPVAPALLAAVATDETTSAVVDLTVRWQHIEPRVESTGLWAGLLAGWLFDEGSGYTFTDVTPNGHDLHVTGSAWNTTDSGLGGSVHRSGVRGQAVALNGSRRLAAWADVDLAPGRAGVSVTAWVLLGGEPARPGTLVGLGPNVALAVATDSHVTWSVTGDSGQHHVVRTVVAIEAHVWTHVTATVDPDTGEMAVYINAVRRAHHVFARMTLAGPTPVSVVLGEDLVGRLDQSTIHVGALSIADVRRVWLLGLPKTFTQNSASIDDDMSVFSPHRGNDPIPHPTDSSTVMNLRFAATLASDQGDSPTNTPTPVYAPADFGCGWAAGAENAVYSSPLTGNAGSFEAWYRPIDDPSDPGRRSSKVVFAASAATGPAGIVLSTLAGRWRVDLTGPSGRRTSAVGREQPFVAGDLSHVAVTWGPEAGGSLGVHLYVDGRPVAFRGAETGGTTFDGTVAVGGSPDAPSHCLLADVRLSSLARTWGGIGPRGQAVTNAAGLDLRDFFSRAPGSAPPWWSPGVGGSAWVVVRREWQHPDDVDDAPAANLAVRPPISTGVQTMFHPDAYGMLSSIEANVALEGVIDGWSGVFVQSSGQSAAFSGITFMLNVKQNKIRLARFDGGQRAEQKLLGYDFGLLPRHIYELTLSCSADGVVRGFVDQINMISMTRGDWPAQGWAGLITDGTSASFSAVHFTALTPAAAASRTIITSRLRYGGAPPAAESISLVPFQWRKRRGLLPWQYRSKNPEPAGNIAGADSAVPRRPILPAHWRSEDSANSDLIMANGSIWYLMRGNPRVNGGSYHARIGMLHTAMSSYDGIHFTDPNLHTDRIAGGGSLLTSRDFARVQQNGAVQPDLNNPSSAYAGRGLLLFLGRESWYRDDLQVDASVFARFDVRKAVWVRPVVHETAWSNGPEGLRSSSELVTLRNPQTDEFQAVAIQQRGAPPYAVMCQAMIGGVTDGTPHLVPDLPIHNSLSRRNGEPIYGFRVMFDNGIYYLHYNDGPSGTVPDWPSWFVLTAALDPYTGPWVANPDTLTGAGYLSRGTPFQPDNAAIWQGCMFKFRGHYYLYYENFHAIGDVDAEYANYDALQVGSRVGYATG